MFNIHFSPTLPTGRTWDSSESVNVGEVFWGFERANVPTMDVIFHIHSADVRYHPANPGALLIGLLREFELSRDCQNHALELSGYPVADLCFKENDITFYIPSLNNPSLEPSTIAATVYLEELRSAIGTLLDYAERMGIRNRTTR